MRVLNRVSDLLSVVALQGALDAMVQLLSPKGAA